jgi:hypothetical protein
MEDPAKILEALAEAERSLNAAKAAYTQQNALATLQNLIVCSMAVTTVLAVVALPSNAPSTQINVPDRRADGGWN